MKLVDKDLASIQAVRSLINGAYEAQKALAGMSQRQLDNICRAISDAGMEHAERLGRMACEETGFGVARDKKLKNEFAARIVYEHVKDMKTVGVLSENRAKGIIEVGVPVGVIAALIPSTNPTSTVIYKALVALKAGNSIVFSPHPSALRCITEAVRVVREAAEAAGCPENAIACMEILTMESTKELMSHPKVALILATGGSNMVKAAYSSGNPAIGVGPGNGPAFIEKTADIKLAVKRVLDSKTFDNGTVCASEQSIIVERKIEEQVVAELKAQGAYFLNEEEKAKVGGVLFGAGGFMNPAVVGKSPQVIARLAGITAPESARVLIAYEDRVGRDAPFSKEKLCPVLAFYVEDGWREACRRSIEILQHEGAGHTMMIHSSDEEVIREFALQKPVNRLLINTPGALGGIGATTNLAPSLTLGCGAVGGSSSSDNISPMHLINIRRAAYGVKELQDLRGKPENGDAKDGEVYIQSIVNEIMRQLQNK